MTAFDITNNRTDAENDGFADFCANRELDPTSVEADVAWELYLEDEWDRRQEYRDELAASLAYENRQDILDAGRY